jgi:hypothetical protein
MSKNGIVGIAVLAAVGIGIAVLWKSTICKPLTDLTKIDLCGSGGGGADTSPAGHPSHLQAHEHAVEARKKHPSHLLANHHIHHSPAGHVSHLQAHQHAVAARKKAATASLAQMSDFKMSI